MRQAGRYMKDYRDVRGQGQLFSICARTPELVAEVTVTPVERLNVDAAILFADILLLLEPMGVGLEYATGGPVIQRPVRTGGDVDALRDPAPEESLSYVYAAVRSTRAALAGRVPLIGFCGAPFTLASYLIEGGASRNYIHTKRLFHTEPGAWNALMERLVASTLSYVNAQIEAGIDALQVFDSWVGCLAPDDYREYVLPHMRRLIAGVKPGVPVYPLRHRHLRPAGAHAGGGQRRDGSGLARGPGRGVEPRGP